MDSYQSSENIQRAHAADVFAANERRRAEQTRSEVDRLKAFLDIHIDKHSSTTAVRKMCQENGRAAEYQLDLSAEIVEILEKIKNELR